MISILSNSGGNSVPDGLNPLSKGVGKKYLRFSILGQTFITSTDII